MASVLIVDDEYCVCEVLARFLTLAGHGATPVLDGAKAIDLVKQRHFDVAVVDLKLPDRDGLTTFDDLRRIQPSLAGILITGHPVYPQGVVSAIRRGFSDYLEKPIRAEQLVESVSEALSRHRLAPKPTVGADQVDDFPELVGQSAAMQDVRSFIRRSAPTNEAILIQGETGTGKELVARAIHECSRRKSEPFTAVNCGAIGPDTLLESELFGHERGAFTGANGRTTGWFEAASGGTLFLDEIGELSRAGQAMLLRALEVGQIVPLGARRALKVDARIVAATNRSLETEASFRRDLYYRLNALDIQLPPLRERPEDVRSLIKHLLPGVAAALQIPIPELSNTTCAVLAAQPWPGNVRELQQELKKACLRAQGSTIEPEHLTAVLARSPASSASGTEMPTGTLRDRLRAAATQLEARLISEALAKCRGNLSAAARLLGVSRRTLQRRHHQESGVPSPSRRR